MPGDWIKEAGDHERHKQIRAEHEALRHDAGNDRGCGTAEHDLEPEEDGKEPVQRLEIEYEQVCPNPSAHAVAEHEGEAEEPEYHRREAEIRQVLDRDIDAVLASCQAAFETQEPCLHDEDQRAADRNPEYVDRWGHLSIFVLIRSIVAFARIRSLCYFSSQALIFSSSLLMSIGLVS